MNTARKTSRTTTGLTALALTLAALGMVACSRQTEPEPAETPAPTEPVAAAATPATDPTASAPAFALPDLDGQTRSLSDYRGQIVVLEWINKDCPFVRKHYSTDNMQTLQRSYAEQGVIWFAICSSAPGEQGHFDIPTWQKRAEDSRMAATAILLDTDGVVGRAYGATHTPHMFVINAEGHVVYAGAIDDDRSSDPAKVAGARNFVAEALDATLRGEAVATPRTAPYGCTVKY